jgi:signal peptidase II
LKKNHMKKKFQDSEDIIGRINSFLLISLLVFILDRISKYIVLKYLSNTKVLIPGFLNLEFTKNTGAAFGLFTGKTILLIGISILFIILIIVNLKLIMQQKYYFAFALILGGAISNLFDRIVFKYVIDFIDVPFFSVFNLADSAISIGAVIALIYLLKYELKK